MSVIKELKDKKDSKKKGPKSASKRIFYCINLNGKYGGISKWSVYEYEPNFDKYSQPLVILWPEHEGDELNDKIAKKQGFDIQNRDGNMPKFYFKISGYGFFHSFELKQRVARIKGIKTDEMELYELRGFYPSNIN